MEQTLSAFVNAVNDVLWNKQLLLLFLLLGTGIYFTVRTRFIQVRGFGEGLRRVFGGFSLNGEKAGKHGMSSFQALTTAIAAQVGTGNITGCATALYSGGPGAIFWMWFSAFFGMATIYGEAVLAQLYKTKGADGQTTGGPIYYIRAAYKGRLGKGLAVFFSVAIILALGFMGNMVQSNSIGEAFYNAFGVPRIVMGVLAAAIAAFIFIGGVKRLASVTEKMVPVMAGLYIVGGLIVLFINREALPGALKSIFVCAFEPQAMFGGVAGLGVKEAMRYGVARGLFSNEAGMGSTPHAHALARVDKPQDQGLAAMIGVFIDTFIVLTMTALVILSSGLGAAAAPAGGRPDRHRPGPGGFQPGVRLVRQRLCGGVHAVLRVFHHHRLVLLWRDQRQGPARAQGGAALCRHCGAVHRGGLGPEGGSGLEYVRYVQRPDGHPQPAGRAGAVRRGGKAGPGRQGRGRRGPERGRRPRRSG